MFRGFRVLGVFRVFSFRVFGFLGFRVEGLGWRVEGLRFRFRVEGLGLRVPMHKAE